MATTTATTTTTLVIILSLRMLCCHLAWVGHSIDIPLGHSIDTLFLELFLLFVTENGLNIFLKKMLLDFYQIYPK